MAGPEPAPIFWLMGLQLGEVGEGQLDASIPASEWLCYHGREIAPGVLAHAAYVAATGAGHTLSPADSPGVLDMSSASCGRSFPTGGPPRQGSGHGAEEDLLLPPPP